MIKAQTLNEGKNLMFVLNDITRIKQLEKEMSSLRSMYFS